MFAILETGGKQYKVEEGDILEVELLETENEKKKKVRVVQFEADGKNRYKAELPGPQKAGKGEPQSINLPLTP